MKPTPLATIALASCLLAAACSSPQEPALRPPAPVRAPEPEPPSDEALAEEAGIEVADDVLVGALGRSGALVEALPTPVWSHFPNMEGERVRAPLSRRAVGDRPRPVLLVMLDTTRADRLGAYGHDRETSPHIDGVAEEGVRFSRFYANGAWTRPSVVSMMTSTYRGEHGVEVGSPDLPEEQLTLAEMFKGAGYATAAFVGNRSVTHKNGFDQGFDLYEDPYEGLDHQPRGDEVAERVVSWLSNNDNPNFFVWMFVVDPHDPYEPQAEHDLWPTDYKGHVGVPYTEYDELPPERYVERMLSLYDGEIHQMDAGVGRVFAHLKAAGVWDDLTVAVVADHGEAFGENGCFRHPYHFWEPNINVPLIVKSPAWAGGEGMVEDRLFEGVDLAPTLLELAGVAPEGFRPAGVSAASVLTGPITAGWDRAVYTEMEGYGIERYMVRRGRYKYLRFEPTRLAGLEFFWKSSWERLTTANHTDVREHLFDVEADPKETENLTETMPEQVEAMRAALQRFSARVEAGQRRPPRVVQDRDIPAERLDELRALGYME